MRAFAALIAAVIVAIGGGLGALSAAGSTETDALPFITTAPKGPIELFSDGIGPVTFSTKEATAFDALQLLFGTAGGRTSTSPINNCGVTGTATWRNVYVVFELGKFVGYRIGSAMDTIVSTPSVVTAKGLRLGDTISQAQRLYGNAFTTSAAQGGSWIADTSTRRLFGLLVGPPGPVGPSDRVEEIAGGLLGCA